MTDGAASALSEVDDRQVATTFERIALWLVLAPVIIDYRIADDATASVVTYTLVTLANLLGAAMLLAKAGFSRIAGLRLLLIVASGYLTVAIASGLANGDNMVDVVRASSPILIFTASVAAISAISNSSRLPEDIWIDVLKAAFIGVVVQFALVVAASGIDLSRVRYEVLTGVAPYVTAVVVVSAAYGGWRPWTSILAGLHVFLLLLSVTRTQLVVAAVSLFAVFAVAPLRFVTRRSLYRFLAIAPVVVGVLVVVDSSLPVSQLDRWWARLIVAPQNSGGIDVTEITRVGEATYQLGRLSESPFGLTFGFGPAADTQFDERSAQLVASLIGIKGGLWEGNGFGHNNYVGTVFVGGLLFGVPLLLMQMLTAVKGAAVFRQVATGERGLSRTVLLAVPAAVVAYLAYGLLGGTMGSRSASALFGMALASTWWLADSLRRNSGAGRQ